MDYPFPPSHIELPIPYRFEAIAGEFPERIAVRTHRSFATYREIDNWANAIAHAIVEAGGAPGEVIAVMFGKDDIAIVAAFFAVLKAGRIYAALDPLATPEHNSRVVKSCRPAILLTDAAHAGAAKLLA